MQTDLPTFLPLNKIKTYFYADLNESEAGEGVVTRVYLNILYLIASENLLSLLSLLLLIKITTDRQGTDATATLHVALKRVSEVFYPNYHQLALCCHIWMNFLSVGASVFHSAFPPKYHTDRLSEFPVWKLTLPSCTTAACIMPHWKYGPWLTEGYEAFHVSRNNYL